MPITSYGVSLSGAGSSIARSLNRTTDGVGAREVTLPAGKAGTLTTRTDNDTGEVTLGAGHGIITADKIDLFWSGGRRYGVTVGTVAGNVVPIDLGAGDNLPIATTAIVATKQVQVNADIDGDALAVIGIEVGYTDPASAAVAHVDLQDSGSASIEALDMLANIPRVWDITGGASNVFAGNPITKAMAANGSSTVDAILKIIWGGDSTP